MRGQRDSGSRTAGLFTRRKAGFPTSLESTVTTIAIRLTSIPSSTAAGGIGHGNQTGQPSNYPNYVLNDLNGLNGRNVGARCLARQRRLDRTGDVDAGQLSAVFAGAVDVFDDVNVVGRFGSSVFDDLLIELPAAEQLFDLRGAVGFVRDAGDTDGTARACSRAVQRQAHRYSH